MKEGDQKDRFLIFGFFRKILNKEETKKFQDRMKDEVFQEKISDEAVRQYGRIQLNSKLNKIHKTIGKEKKRRRIYTCIFLAVLAILIAIICWQIVNNDSNKPPEIKPHQVFASYFEPYASLFEQKGEATTEELGFMAAMHAYTDQDYAKAARLLEKFLNQSTSKKSLPTFYYSMALLADGQSNRALNILLQLKEGSNSNTLLSKESLYWYLALAHLEESNVEEARLLLEWIANRKGKSLKKEEAKEILKRLK